MTRKEVAGAIEVSVRRIASARFVRRYGVPELAEWVEAGSLKMNPAEIVAGFPIDEQQRIVAGGPGAVKEAAAEWRRGRAAIKWVEQLGDWINTKGGSP